MKKLLSVLLCAAILLGTCPPAFAYSFPAGFWKLNEKYDQALTDKDYGATVEYGNEIINLMETAPDAPEKTDVLITRYNEVGLAYAAVGDYENSARVFEKLYDCAKDKDGYYDYTRGAKARAAQYKPSVSMYTDKGTSPYFGSANEKNNGVLFGICANGASRNETKNESMVLLYQEFGHPLVAQNTYVIQKASEAGIAVEYALNCPNEGDDIRNIGNMDKSLKEVSDVISYYPDVPVYLRFAAEFDIWQNRAEPEEFKEAFIRVSEYFRHRNPNVAIVWSPNQVSAWDVDIDDYYPGDEYVDWVGISLYAQRYFDGDGSEAGEVFFKTGDNSDPVIAIRDIVEKYGGRKPIMIAECGCGHRIVTSGENTEDFALLRLREMFSYLPMIYPQIMLMYGKEASNRKQEIDRQHYTIPNQRPKDKHCGKI